MSEPEIVGALDLMLRFFLINISDFLNEGTFKIVWSTIFYLSNPVRDLGILEYMYNIYMDEKRLELIELYKEHEKVDVELFPYKITPENADYWKYTLNDDWYIADKIDLDNLIDDYELRGIVDWTELYNVLPEDIDDDVTEMDGSEEEEFNLDEEETDDDIEEGEIVDDN